MLENGTFWVENINDVGLHNRLCSITFFQKLEDNVVEESFLNSLQK